MLKSIITSIVKLFNYVLVVIVLLNCASSTPTKPNIPYAGPYPTSFKVLTESNPLLVQELGKLPEIQDGISLTEIVSLDKLAKLYDRDKIAFDRTFEKMYEAGIPETRKYCSPLQALFWLIEDGNIEGINIVEYSQKVLIFEAWLKKGFENNDEKGRWQDFGIVTDRLNSPELIEFYIRWNFTHCSRLDYGKGECPPQTPDTMFKYKKGNCEDFSYFAVHCLKKAGYRAKVIRVIGRKRANIPHAACEYSDTDGNEYVIDLMTGKAGIYTKEAYTRNFKIR
jgi:hypothetical protein